MTREEAIILIERAANELREMMKTITMPTSAAEQLQQEIDAHEIAISALRQQEHPQWISVKDRMPSRYETVLIAISTVNGYGDPAKLVTIGGYDHSEKRWEQYTSTDRQLCRGETVTHWMPLPEPPEEDDHA